VRIAETFERIGAVLYAAEAAAAAAEIFRQEGRIGSAFGAGARARVLTEQCEGARTPALLALDASLPLTRREHEIAGLAARGLSNRQIAEHLVVSVRTVDNHLHRVYGKLGITRRAELAAILLPEPRERLQT
jgi:DNA-binding NarL/FixJ family response regulator